MARPSLLAALLAGCVAGQAQQMPWQSSAESAKDAPAVRYEYPEQVSVAAGETVVVELHFRVRDGMHINSHVPLQKSLVRTELMVVEPPGVKVATVDFPDGADFALKALPNEKLSVYTGEVVLRAHLAAVAGEHLVQAALRYQACDANACYPPRKVPVAFDVVAR